MKKKDVEALRMALIAMLNDLEQIKKEGEKAVRLSNSIGGPLKGQMAALMEKLKELERECLKLEQETREI
jgi:benzoyl-CoA reductase/2-hydroxyglutaryl-CoA dehydratase subunit BcrC/BadD/HgdB